MSFKIDDIYKVVKIVENHSCRPKNDAGHPGGLIDLSKDKRSAIIIGDLHGAIENLEVIIEKNEYELKEDKTRIIIIGDGVHNDQTGHMLEMHTSLDVLEKIFKLTVKYQENIIYIRGNHDTFDARLAKSGIKQGLEFQNYLEEHRSEDYVDAVSKFFESLPVFVIGNGFIVTHGGPIRNGATKNEIINIEENPFFYHQLIWNRLHEFRGNPSNKEYGEEDIRSSLKKLKLPEDTPFIVGHNPMWSTGNHSGIWRDIIGIKNHIIIYTNIGTRAPYLKIENGTVTEKYGIQEDPRSSYV